MLPIGAIFSGKVPGLDVPGNDQARFGYPTFGPTALVSPIVGMAQGALDAFTETARDAKRMARPGVFEKVAESPLIQSLIGEAAARIDAARTLMVTSLREGQDVVRAGGTLDIEQRVRIRRNHGFAGADLVRGRQRDLRQVRRGGGRREESRSAILARCQHRGAAFQHRLGHAVGALRHAATGPAAAGHLLRSHLLRSGAARCTFRRPSAAERRRDLLRMFGEDRRLLLEACRGLERDADLARNDMHMQVEHDLPARRLVELLNGEAVGGKRLHGRAADRLHCV